MEEITYILHKKLRNEAFSKEEEKTFSDWISSSVNQELFNEYKKVWSLTASKPSALKPDVDAQWNKFKSSRINSSNSQSNIRSIFKAVVALAAMFVFIFGITSVIVFYTNKVQTYTAEASMLEITLPDSSIVFLNKNSTLLVENDFNKRTRTVKLNGEAFFEVKKNQTVPFIVEMEQGLLVKVLGTTFNLRTSGKSSLSELRVLEGKVLFEKAEKSIVVVKFEEVVFDNKTGNFSDSKPIDKNLLAWHTRSFSFDNAPISEVMHSFERYFNKTIELPQNTSHLRYSGTFNNPSETEIAEIISLALGWEYALNNTSIHFTSK